MIITREARLRRGFKISTAPEHPGTSPRDLAFGWPGRNRVAAPPLGPGDCRTSSPGNCGDGALANGARDRSHRTEA